MRMCRIGIDSFEGDKRVGMGQRKLRISSRKAVEVPVVVLDNLEKDEEVFYDGVC